MSSTVNISFLVNYYGSFCQKGSVVTKLLNEGAVFMTMCLVETLLVTSAVVRRN